MIKTLEYFSDFNSRFPANPAWSQFRQRARNLTEKVGVPSKSNDDWKYTSLKFLSDKDYQPALLASKEQDLKIDLPAGFYHLVFQNGHLVKALSDIKTLENNFEIKYADEIDPSEFSNDIQIVGPGNISVLDSMNSAFFAQAIYLKMKDNASLAYPLMISHLVSTTGSSVFPSLQIIVGKASKLTVIENFSTQYETLTSSVSAIKLEENSSLEYVQVIDEHAESVNYRNIKFYLHQNSTLNSLVVSGGGKTIRQNLNCFMMGAGASAKINGMTLGGQKNHIDHHTLVDHVVGSCNSTQLYKSILDGESRSVFDGRVLIRKDSQKASSDQLNKNLLLSSKAEADTKPNLEIYADDVKATHGATVGQLNKEELFYLLSRAISKDQALEMLSLGFVLDLLEDVQNQVLRQWLADAVKSMYQRMKA